jgi:putative addiction module component (TIGR02574 family)
MGRNAIQIDQLSRDEQLELLDQLWEALGEDPEALPLTEAQKQDLDQRLDELEREGPAGVSWEEAVAQIRSRRR